MFHAVTQEDYERYGKLRNVKLYEELGYNMPVFYVLDDKEVVGRVISGQIPPGLEGDLAELTKRPLIIRTDGASIPGEKSEMLPRSDELRSHTEAVNWLLTDFKSKIEKNGLGDDDLCLIAHHFIPSPASAWARAEPGNRIVRIESLWGIPEGLYWHSHDTFEVDTQTTDVGFGRPTASLNYKSWGRLRYKGTFIAPNEDGKWIPYQTAPPYDWNKSISKKRWLFEIAHITRQVAEREKCAMSVMWFIDNHLQATEHKVLPWFHSKSELAGPPEAAPRQKRKSASDFSIKSIGDWQQLQQDLQSGKYIERVVVEPVDPELIRNPQFAKDLADLAALKKFVVELSGGILSHVYYILQSRGAQVECIDLFGADEDVIEFNKVVRDKVPTLIERRGERTETVKLVGDALLAALQQKLVEEAFEALDVKSGEDLIGELADIQEVVKALCQALGVNPTDIETERKEKEKRRGGFQKGLMLVKTTTPHSIQKQSTTPEPPTLGLRMQQSSEPAISDVEALPARSLYRRPDLRQVNQQLEKLFTFETEANKIGEIKETLDFSMPMDNQRERGFTLTVELRRTHSSVRGVVRLGLRRPLQLEIEFPK
jgi:predicted house-cleaning noncanonical NTP pyrophosphatase (MazG superfamily)